MSPVCRLCVWACAVCRAETKKETGQRAPQRSAPRMHFACVDLHTPTAAQLGACRAAAASTPTSTFLASPADSRARQTGFLAGGSFGVIGGGLSAFSSGMRGSQLIRVAGKTGGQSGSMFGLFLAIGAFMRGCN